MMDPKNVIGKLQNKSYETRVKILWVSIIIIALGLIAVWIFSLRGTIQGLNTNNPTSAENAQDSSSAKTQTDFASVERIEPSATGFKIYFNINNPTDDILNFSSLQDIQLVVGKQTFAPKQITDRQGGAFVQKVLSHTQNFGILVFDPITGESGKLTFDQLSLEKTPDQLLKQTLDLDFQTMEQSTEVRN